MRSVSHKHQEHRLGAAAVEFAIVAPLFFLLLAGIIEFGHAFRIQHALSNASRRGARAAIAEGALASDVQQKVKSQCSTNLGIPETDITVEIGVNGSTGAILSESVEGDEVRVTIRIPYSKAGAGFYSNTFSDATLSSTCVLEHE